VGVIDKWWVDRCNWRREKVRVVNPFTGDSRPAGECNSRQVGWNEEGVVDDLEIIQLPTIIIETCVANFKLLVPRFRKGLQPTYRHGIGIIKSVSQESKEMEQEREREKDSNQLTDMEL
jgi:hypothetical protein